MVAMRCSQRQRQARVDVSKNGQCLRGGSWVDQHNLRRDEDEEEGQDMRSITTMAFSLRGVRAAWWDAPHR
jgi:hypothetical protein